MSKHNKSPKVVRTKEELLADLRSNAEFIAKMKFVKEKFWPALVGASTSIDDASMTLSGFNSAIMEKFLGFMKEKKVNDLGLEDLLDKDSEKHEESKTLLDLFSDMDVFTAKTHIESMKGEIETFKLDEMRTRPLSSLKTKWLDEA